MEKRYEEALHLTHRAIFAAQQVHVPESLYRWQWQTGRLLKAMGQMDSAIAAYRSAVNTLQSIRHELSTSYRGHQPSFRESTGSVYFELVDILFKRADSIQDLIDSHEFELNQSTHDWHTGLVTLSGAKGLVLRRDASPAAQHDSPGTPRVMCTNVVWCDLARLRIGLCLAWSMLPRSHEVDPWQASPLDAWVHNRAEGRHHGDCRIQREWSESQAGVIAPDGRVVVPVTPWQRGRE